MSDTWSRTWLTLDVRMGVAMSSPLPVSPSSRVSMARKDNRLVRQRAKLLEVLGVVVAWDQHHVVKAQLAQPVNRPPATAPRHLEAPGTAGPAGPRRAPAGTDPDVGTDGPLAPEAAEP